MTLSSKRIACLFALLAAGCSAGTSGDVTPPPADPLPDGGGGASAGPDTRKPPPSARELELARMQTHLDSLYSQSDVVHRFTTAGGDGVDCVPFEKQPGFSRIRSMNGAAPILDSVAVGGSPRPTSLAGFGEGSDDAGALRQCPNGAVPIRRYLLADLARFASLEDFLRKQPLHVLEAPPAAPAATDPYRHDHAGYSSNVSNWGAQSTMNLWNPTVESNNFSLSQLWVIGSSGKNLQSIEAGYTFDRIRAGIKDVSRLFIYSTQDGYGSTGCYDLTCKDFVQLANSHVVLGGRFDRASVVGGEQREFTLRAQFCPASQCKDWEGWWLKYEAGAFSEWIGFYPRKLYAEKGLRDGASRVDLGGEVAYRAGKSHTATDMGSGRPPGGGFGQAAYQTNLRTITVDNAWASYPNDAATIAESPACYTQLGLSSGGARANPNPTFYFGGTGASAGCK